MLKRRHRWMANARLPFQKGNPDAGRIRAMCGMCECKKPFPRICTTAGFRGREDERRPPAGRGSAPAPRLRDFVP